MWEEEEGVHTNLNEIDLALTSTYSRFNLATLCAQREVTLQNATCTDTGVREVTFNTAAKQSSMTRGSHTHTTPALHNT